MTDICFAYGSLMCEDIMSAVAGMPLRGERAVLCGFIRHPVRDEDYPGAVPEEQGQVDGMIYRGLNDAAWARLDRFEGEMYERRIVRVRSGADEAAAWIYVFRPEYGHRLLPGDWSFERFLQEGKARFLQRYVGFGAI